MVAWWPYNLIDNTIFNAAGVKVGCAKPNKPKTNKQTKTQANQEYKWRPIVAKQELF